MVGPRSFTLVSNFRIFDKFLMQFLKGKKKKNPRVVELPSGKSLVGVRWCLGMSRTLCLPHLNFYFLTAIEMDLPVRLGAVCWGLQRPCLGTGSWP